MIVGFFSATTMPDADWWQVMWPHPEKVLVVMGVRPGMVAVDLCCGDGLFTAPLACIADRVYAIDIDPVMLDRARVRVAEVGATNCDFVPADAMTVDAIVPELVDYIFLANTFHGIPDQLGVVRVVAASLKPDGQFGIVNWHYRPREETVVLGQPRGPKTELRIEAAEVAAIVKPVGLLLNRTVELPPYHYGVVFESGGGMSDGVPVDPLALREEVKSKSRAVAVATADSKGFESIQQAAENAGTLSFRGVASARELGNHERGPKKSIAWPCSWVLGPALTGRPE